MHIVSDKRARPVSLVLSAGQDHDSRYLEPALDGIHVPRLGRGRARKRPRRIVADKAYTFGRCRKALRQRKIAAMIPERSDHIAHRKKKGAQGGRPCKFDKELYKQRNVIERCFLRLKQWRRIATRYDKRAASYQCWLTIASLLLWTK
jgi:transposase